MQNNKPSAVPPTPPLKEKSTSGPHVRLEAPTLPEKIPTLKEFKSISESQYLREVMIHTSGNIRDTVAITGLSRGYLYELLKKHGLSA